MVSKSKSTFNIGPGTGYVAPESGKTHSGGSGSTQETAERLGFSDTGTPQTQEATQIVQQQQATQAAQAISQPGTTYTIGGATFANRREAETAYRQAFLQAEFQRQSIARKQQDFRTTGGRIPYQIETPRMKRFKDRVGGFFKPIYRGIERFIPGGGRVAQTTESIIKAPVKFTEERLALGPYYLAGAGRSIQLARTDPKAGESFKQVFTSGLKESIPSTTRYALSKEGLKEATQPETLGTAIFFGGAGVLGPKIAQGFKGRGTQVRTIFAGKELPPRTLPRGGQARAFDIKAASIIKVGKKQVTVKVAGKQITVPKLQWAGKTLAPKKVRFGLGRYEASVGAGKPKPFKTVEVLYQVSPKKSIGVTLAKGPKGYFVATESSLKIGARKPFTFFESVGASAKRFGRPASTESMGGIQFFRQQPTTQSFFGSPSTITRTRAAPLRPPGTNVLSQIAKQATRPPTALPRPSAGLTTGGLITPGELTPRQKQRQIQLPRTRPTRQRERLRLTPSTRQRDTQRQIIRPATSTATRIGQRTRILPKQAISPRIAPRLAISPRTIPSTRAAARLVTPTPFISPAARRTFLFPPPLTPSFGFRGETPSRFFPVKARRGFSPAFSSIILNVRGRKPTTPRGGFTGLESRPITFPGFNEDEPKKKSRRKKKK